MTRKDYMDELNSRLSFVPEESRQGIMEYYAEMLDDRMEDGLSEESAVAAMEKPADIAARIAQEQPAEAAKAPAMELGDEAARFSAMVDQALDSARKAIDDADRAEAQAAEKEKAAEEKKDQPQAFTPAMDGIFDTVSHALDQAGKVVDHVMDQVANKLNEKSGELNAARKQEKPEEKSADLPPEAPKAGDLGSSIENLVDSIQGWAKEQSAEGGYTQKTLTVPADALNGVDLVTREMPVKITGCGGTEATLTYFTKEDDPYEACVRDGVLTLRPDEKGRNAGPGRFVMNIIGGMVKLWGQFSPTVELSLPREALVDLKAKVNNASIKVNNLAALCDVELKTSNSRIELKDITCKRLQAATSNARQVLENVKAKQDIRCNTSNGRIEGQKVHSGRELSLTTSNSRLLLEDSSAHEALRMTTSNGGLEIRRTDAPNISLRTSNGSIRGALPGSQLDWAIQSGTSNGSNSLPRQQPGMKPLSVHTSNGSIDLHFE